MRIDQLIVLLALVVLANLVLLAALVMPRLAARRTGALLPDGGPPGGLDGRPAGNGGPRLSPAAGAAIGGVLSDSTYERVVRVVSYLFIGSALLVVTVTGAAEQPLTYVVLALGAFLIVLGQDVLPLSLLGRWRYPVEALSVTVFVTLLVLLTGGYQSPFFFGYLLLLAGAALWAGGVVPFVLALLASVAYLLAVVLAPSAEAIGPEAMGIIAFNLVALALISYVAAVIGREQHRSREAALRLSRIDALTGLHTRGYFNTAIEQEVVRGQRNNRPFSLLMIDIDGLKAANDKYGHEAGDRVLRAAADAIRAGIRASDLAARYGGDEFVVVLPETDQAGALRVGEKLRFDLSRLGVRGNGDLLNTSASIGLVSFPDDGRTSLELMRRADLAMYEAKRRGRNQLVRFARPDAPAADADPELRRQPLEPPPAAPAPWEQPPD
jgi:diguanylate cyclase (GGDEF)-like protein